MSELVTVDRQHPDFMSYLRGTFARDRRALPVKSLNVRTSAETVTFKIIPVSSLQRPSWPVIWLKALRPRTFLQVLVPILFVMTSPAALMNADPDLPWLVTLGILCLYASIVLRNDVHDYLSGFDRIRTDRGSRALHHGWLTVAQIERASWIFLMVAGVVALPVLWARPSVYLIALLTLLTGAAGFFRREVSYRDVSTGLFPVFILTGPLLFAGLDVALTGTLHQEQVWAGMLWGWMSLFPVHLRDLEYLIVEGQSGRASLVGRAGFDRAPLLIVFWWGVSLAGFAVYWALRGGPSLLWILFVSLAAISLTFPRRLLRLRSPAGSEVAAIRKSGDILYLILLLLWILGSAWRLTP